MISYRDLIKCGVYVVSLNCLLIFFLLYRLEYTIKIHKSYWLFFIYSYYLIHCYIVSWEMEVKMLNKSLDNL